MKVSDFFKIPMKHIVFESSIYDINKEWSYGQDWVDFPDENIKGISITLSAHQYALKSTDCRTILPVRKKDMPTKCAHQAVEHCYSFCHSGLQKLGLVSFPHTPLLELMLPTSRKRSKPALIPILRMTQSISF